MSANFESRLEYYTQRVGRLLDRALPATEVEPARLHEAMHYAVFNGGKRMRPLLVYASGECLGIAETSLDAPAAAIELLHAFSLVHDDLPAMDNDDLRRGQPTVHRKFDEATAILAADALQPLAFSVIAHTENASANVRLKLVALIAKACGSIGMTGGQSIDLAAEGKTLSTEDLEHMYSLKTGALINASVISACFLAKDLPQEQFKALDNFSQAIGVAFQIKDDILDVEGETHIIGKPAGSDADLNKATYPLLFGVAAARRRCDELLENGVEHLNIFGQSAASLRWLASYITERGH